MSRAAQADGAEISDVHAQDQRMDRGLQSAASSFGGYITPAAYAAKLITTAQYRAKPTELLVAAG